MEVIRHRKEEIKLSEDLNEILMKLGTLKDGWADDGDEFIDTDSFDRTLVEYLRDALIALKPEYGEPAYIIPMPYYSQIELEWMTEKSSVNVTIRPCSNGLVKSCSRVDLLPSRHLRTNLRVKSLVGMFKQILTPLPRN